MPGKVNRVPQGLLSLLDMKAQGENPNFLSDTLLANVDITDLYLAPQRAIQSQSITTTGIGSLLYTALAPPPGELWFCRNATAQQTAGVVAGTLRFALGFQPGGNTGFFIGLGDSSATLVVGERGSSVALLPFVLQPADQMAILVENWTVGPAGGVRITMAVARLAF